MFFVLVSTPPPSLLKLFCRPLPSPSFLPFSIQGEIGFSKRERIKRSSMCPSLPFFLAVSSPSFGNAAAAKKQEKSDNGSGQRGFDTTKRQRLSMCVSELLRRLQCASFKKSKKTSRVVSPSSSVFSSLLPSLRFSLLRSSLLPRRPERISSRCLASSLHCVIASSLQTSPHPRHESKRSSFHLPASTLPSSIFSFSFRVSARFSSSPPVSLASVSALITSSSHLPYTQAAAQLSFG